MNTRIRDVPEQFQFPTKSILIEDGWTEEEFLSLDTNLLIEFSDGQVQLLPSPTVIHQLISMSFCDRLRSLTVSGKPDGLAIVGPVRLKIRKAKYREPDVLFMKRENAGRIQDELWEYADFVVEIVGKGSERRDYDDKVTAYAEARVPEYWIVDPQQRSIRQFVLDGLKYREAGTFTGQDRAVASTVDGFSVVVEEIFAKAELEFRLED